jgi:hypothetical protein
MLQVVDNAAGSPQGAFIWLRSVRAAQGQRLQIVTPPGMSTITLTASSGSVTPQAIQLTLTVH